jgi:hypothetical protein
MFPFPLAVAGGVPELRTGGPSAAAVLRKDNSRLRHGGGTAT